MATYANRVLQSIPYGTLIGAPLTAAVVAQGLAAKSSVDFIKSVGFEPGGQSGDSLGPVRQVEFQYDLRDSESGSTRTVTLNVPLLTIVPIPFIRIEELTIDFTSKITEERVRTSESSREVNTDTNFSASYGNFLSPINAELNASVSTTHKSSTSRKNRYKTEHTIDIHARAVQDDIPAGMSRVLDLLQDAIQEPSQNGGGGNG